MRKRCCTLTTPAVLPFMAQNLDADLAADRAQVMGTFAVSRETIERLDRYVALLLEWQRTTNLIAASTLSTVWSRHVGDSLQLLELANQDPRASVPSPAFSDGAKAAKPTRACQPSGLKPCNWVDLGSGAGFPGMVIACALAETEAAKADGNETVETHSAVHLIESNARKAAFLRQAARETGAPAIIHAERIETAGPLLRPVADVITARALAPLDRLCHLVAPILKKGAQALLMKGQDVEAELTQATKHWNIDYDIVPSRSNPSGRIMIVRALSPKR
jgi:16S rRNA (guanine527-N7)-methyltransferase